MPSPTSRVLSSTAPPERPPVPARGWTPTGTVVGVAVGAGIGAALVRVLSAGPALSTWVAVGIGAGVAVAAAKDEAARLRLVGTAPGRLR